MILVFDVGNSETTIGLFEGKALRSQWRVMTGVTRTADEYGVLIANLLGVATVKKVSGAAIGSVVPPVTAPLAEACARWLGVKPIEVDANAGLPIRLKVDEPMTVGADRIINTLAASHLYGQDTIVVDLGTATTFDCITADGVFLGGVIAPGMYTSAETLIRKTSKLPSTEIVAPKHVIGTRTEECIRSGVLYGTAESIDGIVRRIKEEWPRKEVPLVVATGGLAEMMSRYCSSFDRVEPHLTLQGLELAYRLLSRNASSRGGKRGAGATKSKRR